MQVRRQSLHLRIAQGLEIVGGLLFIAILALAIGQVITRYVLNNPSSWTEEVARLLLVWATFIAVGAAAAKEEFLAVDVLLERLPQRARTATRIAINLLMAVVGIVFIVFGWKLYQFTGGDASTSLGYPRNLFYLPVPIGGFFLTAFSFMHVLRYARQLMLPHSLAEEDLRAPSDR